MNKSMNEYSLWVQRLLNPTSSRGKSLSPKGDLQLIQFEDYNEITYKVLDTLYRNIEEPLVNIQVTIGKTVLEGLDARTGDIERDNKMYLKVGSELTHLFVEHDKAIYKDIADEKKSYDFNKDGWHAYQGKDRIVLEPKKQKFDHGYSFQIVEEQQEWFDEAFEGLSKDVKEYHMTSLPQLEDIAPFEGFYHETGAELVRNCNRRVRRDIQQGKNQKFIDILNTRLKVKYSVDAELVDIFKKCQKDKIFTLSNKKMTAKQRNSVKSERKHVLDLADQYRDDVFSYFHFYDNRVGRIYCSANYLKPDGSKLSKSLLRLEDKKPIGKDGLFWMKVHAVNCFGEDKLPIESRYEYFEDNKEEWFKIANNPTKNKDWQQKADDPFCFLAAILEVYRAYQLEDPTKYESGLMVAFDASCSGLECLAALCNDEITGKMCNISGDKLGDYYLSIANSCWKTFKVKPGSKEAYDKVVKELEGITSIYDLDKKTREIGDDFYIAADYFWANKAEKRRKLAKRPCMTYLYSAQPATIASAIWSDWRTEEGFEDLNPIFCFVLAKKLYDTCRTVMNRPTKLMDMFIKLALKDREKGENLSLTAPFTGIRMELNYFEMITKPIWIKNKHTESGRSRLRLFVGMSDKVRYHKTKSSASPCAVHMLDSQIVAGVIDYTQGDYEVSLIHDSFSCAPYAASRLFEDVRTVFYNIFKEPIIENWLKEKDAMDLLDDVEFGNLDLNDVFINEYNFA